MWLFWWCRGRSANWRRDWARRICDTRTAYHGGWARGAADALASNSIHLRRLQIGVSLRKVSWAAKSGSILPEMLALSVPSSVGKRSLTNREQRCHTYWRIWKEPVLTHLKAEVCTGTLEPFRSFRPGTPSPTSVVAEPRQISSYQRGLVSFLVPARLLCAFSSSLTSTCS